MAILELSVLSVDEVPGSNDTNSHVVDSVLGDGSVQNGDGEVGTPERSLAVEADISGHGHIETSESTGNTGVLTSPIRDDEALETELGLEDLVQEVRVLALNLVSRVR